MSTKIDFVRRSSRGGWGGGKPVQALRQRTSSSREGFGRAAVGSIGTRGRVRCEGWQPPMCSKHFLHKFAARAELLSLWFHLQGGSPGLIIFWPLFVHWPHCVSDPGLPWRTEYHRHIDSRSFIINEARSQSELSGLHSSFGLSALRLRPAAYNCQSVMGFVNLVHPILHIWKPSPWQLTSFEGGVIVHNIRSALRHARSLCVL